jgi:hypothetical protein
LRKAAIEDQQKQNRRYATSEGCHDGM